MKCSKVSASWNLLLERIQQEGMAKTVDDLLIKLGVVGLGA